MKRITTLLAVTLAATSLTACATTHTTTSSSTSTQLTYPDPATNNLRNTPQRGCLITRTRHVTDKKWAIDTSCGNYLLIQTNAPIPTVGVRYNLVLWPTSKNNPEDGRTYINQYAPTNQITGQ